MATISKGEGYLYKQMVTPEILKAEAEKTDESYKSVILRQNTNYLDRQGKYFIYSALIDEERFRDYEVKKDNLEIKLLQRSPKDSRSLVTVQFKPVEFKDSDSNDEVIYQVQLCPKGSGHFEDPSFCWRDEGCVDSEVRVSVRKSRTITVEFPDIRDNRYSVKIKATIIHQSHTIKFVQPYVMSYIDVKYVAGGDVRPMFWSLILGIIALVVIVGFIGFRKLKSSKENKGFELQNIEVGNRGYNSLDDDGVTNEESKSEGSPQK